MSGTNQEIISSGLSGAITDGWQYDDLILTALPSLLVPLTGASLAGGSSNGTPTTFESPDINGVINKTRCGNVTCAITTASGSRGQMQSSNAVRFQVLPSSVHGFGADVCFNGGQIDFTQDPVAQLVGFANAGAVIPNQGAYVRPPYVGETNFYKYVLTYFNGTPINVVFDSGVAYDPSPNKFLSIFVLADGINDSITYTIQANGQTDTFTINNVLVTYPLMWGSSINSQTIQVARSGAGTTPIARSIIVDKLYRYIKPNYNY
jgi:hypothetical protein